MNTNELQAQLFQHLKIKLGTSNSLVEELATLLNVSTDSAYRRIRGEKALTFDELYLVCNRYQVSLDTIMNVNTGVILFQGKFIDHIGNTRTSRCLAAHVKEIIRNIVHVS